jgi:hypothetical protein
MSSDSSDCDRRTASVWEVIVVDPSIPGIVHEARQVVVNSPDGGSETELGLRLQIAAQLVEKKLATSANVGTFVIRLRQLTNSFTVTTPDAAA